MVLIGILPEHVTPMTCLSRFLSVVETSPVNWRVFPPIASNENGWRHEGLGVHNILSTLRNDLR